MTKAELITMLDKISNGSLDDIEDNHAQADELLLEYINDNDVRVAYDAIMKWYS
jgi:hypothetical protein